VPVEDSLDSLMDDLDSFWTQKEWNIILALSLECSLDMPGLGGSPSVVAVETERLVGLGCPGRSNDGQIIRL
jgi:hypothetical protein